MATILRHPKGLEFIYEEGGWVFPDRPWQDHPQTSVVTTTERMFVIRDRNGRAEWVDVRKGTPDGDLKAGDMVVPSASDEIREGAAIP